MKNGKSQVADGGKESLPSWMAHTGAYALLGETGNMERRIFLVSAWIEEKPTPTDSGRFLELYFGWGNDRPGPCPQTGSYSLWLFQRWKASTKMKVAKPQGGWAIPRLPRGKASHKMKIQKARGILLLIKRGESSFYQSLEEAPYFRLPIAKISRRSLTPYPKKICRM